MGDRDQEALAEYRARMETARIDPRDPMDPNWFPYKSAGNSRTRAGYIVWAIRNLAGSDHYTNSNVPDAVAEYLRRAGVEDATTLDASHGLKQLEEWGWLTRHVFGKRTTAVKLHTLHPGLAPLPQTPMPGKPKPMGSDVKPQIGDTKPPLALTPEAKLDTIHYGAPQGVVTHKPVVAGGTPAAVARTVFKQSSPITNGVAPVQTPPLPMRDKIKVHREVELYKAMLAFFAADPEAATAWVDAVIDQLTGEHPDLEPAFAHD